MNKRISIIKFISLTAVCFQFGCSPEKQNLDKPNFIIIQLDDLGYSDLGVHGNKLVETPAIDAFAEKSVQFSNFYVNPVCAPTRASLLTGRHFLKTGVSHVHGGKDHLNLNENTMGDIFKKAGYVTGMWGKWHGGTAEGYLPWQRGFDEAYTAQLYKHENSVGKFNGKPVETHKWADDAICDYAFDFIKRNNGKPFLAYMSFLTCHSPLKAPENLIEIYEQKGLSKNLSTLYAMIHHVDRSLGSFFNQLEELGVHENTVIMFMSDNGPAIENGTLSDEDRAVRYVNHLRGHKGNIWENGIKSPLFLYWKGKYENMKVTEVCDVTDIVPTMMELAGLQTGDQLPTLDGISFTDLLENKESSREKLSFNYANPGWPPTDKPWTPEGVMDEYRPVTPGIKTNLKAEEQIISVRKGDFKLLQNAAEYPGSPEPVESFVLVNIANDPSEETNLVDQEERIFTELKSNLTNWFAEIKKSPHAFDMPVFLLNPDKVNTIFAKAPQDISPDLKNAYNFLANWEKGNIAWYKIRCVEESEMKINFEFEGNPPAKARFKVSIGNEERIIEVPGFSSDESLIIPVGDSRLKIECLDTTQPGFALKNLILTPAS
ncbi:MAG: sulfatase-like hydrolase/transferase [Bacteroidales bacterium]